MASSSSKTAHVMNLLSKNRGAEPAPVEEAAPADVPAPVPEPVAPAEPAAAVAEPAPVLLTSLQADVAISTQIKDALEMALEEEAAATPPRLNPVPPVLQRPLPPPPAMGDHRPAPETSPILLPEFPDESELAPLLQAIEQPQPEPPPPPPAPAPAPPPPAPAPAPVEPAPTEGEFINVMHELVDDKVDKYIEMFGLCNCSRCRRDVIALALNNLPTQYVVMPRSEFVLRRNVYEGRYNTGLISQLMWACKQVMDAPRHLPRHPPQYLL